MRTNLGQKYIRKPKNDFIKVDFLWGANSPTVMEVLDHIICEISNILPFVKFTMDEDECRKLKIYTGETGDYYYVEIWGEDRSEEIEMHFSEPPHNSKMSWVLTRGGSREEELKEISTTLLTILFRDTTVLSKIKAAMKSSCGTP